MSNFKLDLRKLTPVAEADRVKGNWYVVADLIGKGCQIVQWSNKDNALSYFDENVVGNTWVHWFAIPPGLPGFPVAELPDEFTLDYSKFVVCMGESETRVRRKISLPPISIPSGTKSEQVAELRKILEWLEK